jgi:hypothetical protein
MHLRKQTRTCACADSINVINFHKQYIYIRIETVHKRRSFLGTRFGTAFRSEIKSGQSAVSAEETQLVTMLFHSELLLRGASCMI